ncbi:hypothetical protein SPRG_08949 [Saprolegnia parasitica CBS 223.65]|uniref:Helicase-associated domain-containing protein n=1 Tax=Saprolegnia parasitica (strain CBS 223.65) TaxID=695850 RepID=A0A067C921_SAPPC|nr:hypothetical protein SPRG_08949 [Saprolegnia parasitica CBS 223.65]KDO25650.1 hypothetical protein SPRG_08949 [Saprolegnia parasitica CBS 223.65]|eukprot:XP_012203681.1 hypothetical protein SPRG_08949 [Saprolegnia parasitica CBS 223.65]
MRSKRDLAAAPSVVLVRRRRQSWEAKLLAMQTFHRLHGHVKVPNSFVVPHDDPAWPPDTCGMRLGSAAANFRNRADTLSPEQKAALTDLGYSWKTTAVPWDLKVAALATYRRLHCHCNVPPEFEVPSHDSAWPQALWTIKLGKVVANIRIKGQAALTEGRRQQLQDLGFVWCPRTSQQLVAQWETNMHALTVYKQLHGHVLVPDDFVVPEAAPWPEIVFNVKLGHITGLLRSVELSPAQRDELRRLGFLFNTSLEHETAIVLSGAATYHQLIADASYEIPRAFVVPASPAWPENLWYLPLGVFWANAVARIAAGDVSTLAALHEAGVYYEPRASAHRFLTALDAFATHHGHVNVPSSYRIPTHEEEQWPRTVGGMDLGRQVALIRASRASVPDDVCDRLQALQFRWTDDDWSDAEIAAAWDVYEQICGHRVLGPTFTVPEDDLRWPSALWTLPLGKLRFVHRPALDARWFRGLQAYYDVFGHVDVPPHYVVPSDGVSWPSELWGLDLGAVVDHLRCGQVRLTKDRLEWLCEHAFGAT